MPIKKVTNSNGTSKDYYHNDTEKYGWLEFKGSDPNEHREAEYQAYQRIKEVAPLLHLPNIIMSDAPKLEVDGQLTQATCGYYIQHLDFVKQFKPIMYILIPIQLDKLGINATNAAILYPDLLYIYSNLSSILLHLSELSMVVNKGDNHVYLLDYGCEGEHPKENPVSDKIEIGLDRIIKAIVSNFNIV